MESNLNESVIDKDLAESTPAVDSRLVNELTGKSVEESNAVWLEHEIRMEAQLNRIEERLNELCDKAMPLLEMVERINDNPMEILSLMGNGGGNPFAVMQQPKVGG